LESGKRHFYIAPTGKTIGFHAMVLVGHRYEKCKNKLYFLLQNWWKNKQFIEVDEDYLEISGANITFIKTPQFSIPDQFAKNFGRYYELTDECGNFSQPFR
jgi:hypothetical protein